METAEQSPYLEYTQAAAYVNVNRVTIWRAVRAGHLRASGPGKAIRFRRDHLDSWMNRRNER
jgi:excisionase family DNA binding protein